MVPRICGKIDEHRIHTTQRSGTDILRDTDYFAFERVHADANALSDGVFARPKFARRGFADDDRMCRVLPDLERAAPDEGNPEELEVICRDPCVGNLIIAVPAV